MTMYYLSLMFQRYLDGGKWHHKEDQCKQHPRSIGGTATLASATITGDLTAGYLDAEG
jgi:hypothetical protein